MGFVDQEGAPIEPPPERPKVRAWRGIVPEVDMHLHEAHGRLEWSAEALAQLLRRAVARGVRIADARHCRPAVHRWREPVPGIGVPCIEQSLADAIEAGDVEA